MEWNVLKHTLPCVPYVTLIFCYFNGLSVKTNVFIRLYTITILFILHLCASVMICTYISINMESMPLWYACAERSNRDNTHIFFKTICCKSISLINPWAMAIAIQSLVLNFAAMAFFFVCYIRDNTFSDRNTSFYHMTLELIVTKISIFIGVSIRHSIMIKVKSF